MTMERHPELVAKESGDEEMEILDDPDEDEPEERRRSKANISTRQRQALDDLPSLKAPRTRSEERVPTESRGRTESRAASSRQASKRGQSYDPDASASGARRRSRSREAVTASDEDATLLEHWRRTGTTGTGVDMTARRTAKTAMYEPRVEEISAELCSFLAERIPVPVTKQFKSKHEKKGPR